MTASQVPKCLQAKRVLPFRSLFTNSDFLAQVQTENKICAQKDKRDSSPNNCSFCRIITISIRARPNARKKIGGGGKLGGTISWAGKVGRKKMVLHRGDHRAGGLPSQSLPGQHHQLQPALEQPIPLCHIKCSLVACVDKNNDFPPIETL